MFGKYVGEAPTEIACKMLGGLLFKFKSRNTVAYNLTIHHHAFP